MSAREDEVLDEIRAAMQGYDWRLEAVLCFGGPQSVAVQVYAKAADARQPCRGVGVTADPQVVAEVLAAHGYRGSHRVFCQCGNVEDPIEHGQGNRAAAHRAHVAEAVVAALSHADTPGAVHVLTEYGTTTCPVEGVRAEVDDGTCSACGGRVDTPGAVGADERAAAVAAVHAMEAVTVEPSVEQYVDAVLATRTSGADERAALGEVIDRLAALKSPLREPANEAAWEQGVKAAIREVRILTARASGAGETGLRGLRFRVGTACDGYAALMESDAPDGEDVESYILGAADAANAIRAALADTAGQAGGETDG